MSKFEEMMAIASGSKNTPAGNQQSTSVAQYSQQSTSGTQYGQSKFERMMAIASGETPSAAAPEKAQSWADKAQALTNSLSKYYGEGYKTGEEADAWGSSFSRRAAGLINEGRGYKGQYDAESESYIDELITALQSSADEAKGLGDYYGQWKSKKDYQYSKDVEAAADDMDSWMSYVQELTDKQDSARRGIWKLQSPESGKAAREGFKSATDELEYAQGVLATAQSAKQSEKDKELFDKYAGQDYDSIQRFLKYGAEDAAWMQEHQYDDAFMSDEIYTRLIAEKQKEIDDYKAGHDTVSNINAMGAGGGVSPESVELTRLEGELEDLKTKQWHYTNNNKYSGLEAMPDFQQRSQYKPDGGQVYERNAKYNYINGAKDEASQRTHSAYVIYNDMTAEEIARYNYLFSKSTVDADAYLDSLEPTLNQRSAQRLYNWSAGVADSGALGAIAGSVGSVAANAVGGVTGLASVAGQSIDRMVKGEYKPIDFSTPGLAIGQATSIFRGRVSQNITNATGGFKFDETKNPVLAKVLNGKGLGDVYQAGMSFADSMALGQAFGPLAAGIILGSNAAASTMVDYAASGATDKEAICMGIIAGTFEMLFESWSIDKILNNPYGFFKGLGYGMLTEGSEEFNTTAANTLADWLVMQDKSKVKQAYNEFKGEGLSDTKALMNTVLKFGGDAAWDGLMGALSGALGGGANGYANQQNASVGQYIPTAESMTPKSVDELIAQTLEDDPDNILAQKLKGKLDAKKKISTRNTAALLGMNDRQAQIEIVDAALEQDPNNEKALKAKKLLDAGTNADVRDISTLSRGLDMPAAEKADAVKGDAAVLTDEAVTTEQAENTEKPARPAAATAQTVESAQDAVTLAQAEDVDKQTEDVTIEQFAEKYENSDAVMGIYKQESGQDVAEFSTAFEAAYDMGASGLSESYATDSKRTQYLSDAQRKAAWSLGRKASSAATAKSASAIASGIQTGENIVKKGSLKGEGVTISDLTKTLNDPQRKAYKALAFLSDALGVDIVLTNDSSTVTDADGNEIFAGEQGRFSRRDGKIYIAVNAGLYYTKDVGELSKYTMLRSFCHEFTHFIEKWNPTQYSELRRVVFDELTQRGKNVDDMIEEVRAQSKGMSYDSASREVVAEAMTDILPDSKFIETLANKHQSLYEKMLEKLKEFYQRLLEAWRGMQRNPSAAANALKTEIDGTLKYMDSIVKAFDKAAVGAVENYRLTTGTEQVKAEPVKKTATQTKKAAAAENTTTTKTSETVKPVSETAEKPAEATKAQKEETAQPVTQEAGVTTAESETTSINTEPSKHTELEQNIIEDYRNSVDLSVKAFIERIKALTDNKRRNSLKHIISGVSEKTVNDTKRILGIDVSGYKHVITGSALDHVEKRHGKHGQADNSMSDINDIARIGYVLENYDGAYQPVDNNGTVIKSNVWKNSDGSQADRIVFYKKINGIYYVIEAAPYSKAKFLAVENVYMSKKSGSTGTVLNLPKGQQVTSSTPQRTTTSDNSIRYNAEIINTENDDGKQTAENVSPEIVETTEKLEDFGEKIGGARKDAWSSRGLLASDLTDMNEREREANVKKDKVWKRPDYKKLVAGGKSRGVLYAVNEIRKAVNPNIYYGRISTPEGKLKKQEQYISTVREIQKLAEGIETADDVLAIAKWLEDNGYIEIYNGSLRYTEKYRSDPALAGSNLSYQLSYLRSNWARLDKMADKANFLVDATSEVPKGYEIYQANGDSHNGEWFITKGHFIVGNYFPTYEDALSALREANNKKKQRTRFVPPQLLEVHRKGPNYRANADVDGDAYIETFGFKGGEFGNWMNAKDRKVSMNYGFDALKDLAAALGMTDSDISLSGNLSIAFGSRGKGLSGAAAHYEPMRHVINLTKMNGAGSLAHEWFHALDDYIGGYKTEFASDNVKALPTASQAAMRKLISTMQYRESTDEETDLAATKRYEQTRRYVEHIIKSWFPWAQKMEDGTLTDADTTYYTRKPNSVDLEHFNKLFDALIETADPAIIDKLSTLKKGLTGRVISKEDREAIGLRVMGLKQSGKVQHFSVRTDFYNNSREFGKYHAKDGDYWDSTIEMAARAFACYVSDKTGNMNDYLSAHSDTCVTFGADAKGNITVIKAFPEGEERTRINAAFDELFDALKADWLLHQSESAELPEDVQYMPRKNAKGSTYDKAAYTYWDVEVALYDALDHADKGQDNLIKVGKIPLYITRMLGIKGDFYLYRNHAYENLVSEQRAKEEGRYTSGRHYHNLDVPLMAEAIMSLNSPTATIATKTREGNPAVIEILPLKDKNKTPLYAVLSFYSNKDINGEYNQRPHVVLTIAPRNYIETEGREDVKGLLEKAVKDGRVLDLDEKTRAELSVKAQTKSLGFVTAATLSKNVAQFRKEINRFKEKNKIQYQQRQRGYTDVEVLEIAAEQVSTAGMTDAEKDALRIFQERLGKLRDLQDERQTLGQLYRQQQFGVDIDGNKVKVDREAAEATKRKMDIADSRIETAKNALVKVEQAPALRRILKEARAVVEQSERDRGQDLLRAYRADRDESAGKKKYRARVQREVESLRQMLMRPSNKDIAKHVPAVIQKSVADFITTIDLTSSRQLRGGEETKADALFAEKMRAMRDAIKSNIDLEGAYSGYADLPDGFMDSFQQQIDYVQALIAEHSGEFVVNRMSAAGLRELAHMLADMRRYIQNMNRFHNNSMFAHAYEAGSDSMQYMTQLGKATGKKGAAYNFMAWQYMRPALAFSRFGKGGESIYNEFREGQAQQAFLAKDIIAFSKEVYNAKEVEAWSKEIKTFTIGDEEVSMPATAAMSFYCLYKRAQALTHIYGEGIRIANFKNGKYTYRDEGHALTPEEAQSIISSLSPRQVEVATALQQYMSKECAQWGNYVSMKRFGTEIFGEEHYFPINSDGRHLQAEGEESPALASLYALLNTGFTKELKKNANNRLVLYNIFDVFANHAASMVQYRSFALPVLDALKWFNYHDESGSLRDKMATAYGAPLEQKPGSGAKGYAEQFVLGILKAYNGTAGRGDAFDNVGIRALHRFNRAQVAFNVRVVVQQPLAITRAAMILKPEKLAAGLGKSAARMKALAEEMEAHSGIAAWKSLGFYDTNISKGLTSMIKQGFTLGEKITDVGMKGAEVTDRFTWAAMWSACKDTIERRDFKTDEEYFAAVTALFEQVIYKTQVVDSVLTKSEFLRAQSFFPRMAGAFMSEPSATVSLLTDAYLKYSEDIQRGMSQSEAWQRNGKAIGKTIAVYAVGQVLLAAAQAVADAWRDDDDYLTFAQKYLEALKGNVVDELMPFGKVPFVSEFYDLSKDLLSKFGVDTYGFVGSNGWMQYAQYLSKAVEIFADKAMGNSTKYTIWGGIYNLLRGAAGLTGVPVATTTREVIDVWNNIIGAFAPKMKIKTYDNSTGAQAYESVLKAYQQGRDLQVSSILIQFAAHELENGKSSQWEAEYSVKSELQSKVRTWFIDGEIDETTARGLLEYTNADIDEVILEYKGKVETGYTKTEAESAFIHGEIEKNILKDYLIKYSGLSIADADARITKLSCEKDAGIVYDHMQQMYLDGAITTAKIESLMVKYGGKDKEAAESTVLKWTCLKDTGIVYDDISGALARKQISAAKAADMLEKYGGKDSEAAENLVNKWEFIGDNSEMSGISAEAVEKYNNSCAAVGISQKQFFTSWETVNGIFGDDLDGDGVNDMYTSMDKKYAYINSLPLTTQQKTALALAIVDNASETNIAKRAPW